MSTSAGRMAGSIAGPIPGPLPGPDGSGSGSDFGSGTDLGFADAWDGRDGRNGHAGLGQVERRVEALRELLVLSRSRIDAEVLADAAMLLDRVAERRALSLDHTVVALAGATGSGKSSLFNALAGLELSEAGVRRPTTASPVACAWDLPAATGLLDRLGIAGHARFARRSLLDEAPERPAGSATGARAGAVAGSDGAPAGIRPEHLAGPERLDHLGHRDRLGHLDHLVLLDLPDHDSAASGHRAQVDRLLELVDVVVWVVDPEKYADAVLHERYLRPMAKHADVMLVVLNQVDRLPAEAAEQVLDDLRGLLDEDGIAVGEHGEAGAVVLAASALTGEGVDELRALIGQITAERTAAVRRLTADLDRVTARLRSAYIGDGTAGPTDPARGRFAARLAEAVGAKAAGRMAEREWSAAAERACGVRWNRLGRSRPGPQRGGRGTFPGGGPDRRMTDSRRRTTACAAARPVMDEAVRMVAAAAADGLPAPWAEAVRDAARQGARGLPEALDAVAVRARENGAPRPRWWSVATVLQWLLMMLAVGSMPVLGAAVGGVVRLPLWGPAVLVGVGFAGGPVLAWVCRAGSRGPARRHGRTVERRLRDAAAECGRVHVLEPVAAELLRYREVRERYAVAAGG